MNEVMEAMYKAQLRELEDQRALLGTRAAMQAGTIAILNARIHELEQGIKTRDERLATLCPREPANDESVGFLGM